MKYQQFPACLRRLACLLSLLAFAAFVAPAFGQQKLSLADVMTALRSPKATRDQKNKLLSEGVKTRGITFAINPELEKELRSAGASDGLIDAIRALSPASEPQVVAEPQPSPEVKPEVKTEPTPAPTPDFVAFRNSANESFVRGDLDAAIADYGRAIEINPSEAGLFFSRGLARLNKQDFAGAINDFDKVVELDPNETTAFAKRAAALEKTNNLASAAADYEKVLALDPENADARASLDRVRDAIARAVQPTQQKVIVIQNKPVEPPMKAPKLKNKKSDNEKSADIEDVGSLAAFADRLAVPVYPASQRQRNIEGIVVVEVILDEKGEIESTRAIYGPLGLRQSAEDAVRRSKFKPVTSGGEPVRAKGFINYNFKAN